MIASENFVPQAVLDCQGSVLTNKYAEGYPGKRYYGGCEFVDVAEQLAIDRAKELFGAEHANVQPHAGAQANNAVYHAFLQPGDRILGMKLDHGGHLSHGMKLNVSGRLYEVHAYGVREEDSLIDYDALRADRARVEAADHRRRLVGLPAPARLRARSARSPTRSARSCSSTWRTSPASSPRASTRTRCPTPTSSRPRSTRRSAARAAA